MVESVTAQAEKGAGMQTTLYVGQEEEEEVEEEVEEVVEVGAGRRKDKPHKSLMISVQKVRIRPGKGKGKSDGWFPQPLTHNTRRVCTDDPETKLSMHSLCPKREWEREWYGVTTPNIFAGQGVILFPFGAKPPPLLGGRRRWSLPDGGDQIVPAGHHHGEEGGGGWRGRPTSPSPPLCGLGGKRPNGRMPLREKHLRLFCACLG